MVKRKVGDLEVTQHVFEMYCKRILEKDVEEVNMKDVEEEVIESIRKAEFGKTKEKGGGYTLCYFDDDIDAVYILKDDLEGNPQLRTLLVRDRKRIEFLSHNDTYR